LLCHGSINADAVGGFDRPRSADDRLNAIAFSCTIRAYSAGEHVPRAIIKVRRPIVSQEARVISSKVSGSNVDRRRLRFGIR
jgi:hypothetical protein